MTDAPPPDKAPPRLGGLAVRQGVVVPRHLATTAHLCVLYPFALQADLGHRGVLLGRNRLTGGGGFFFDLFEAYEAGLVQGPNMVVCGAGAHGKSAIVKSYLYRSSILSTGRRRRFTAVVDPKGEWLPLARRLGWAVLSLRPGAAVRVNPLDCGPAARSPQQSLGDVAAHRASVATTMLAISLGVPELTASQRRLVGAALRRLAELFDRRRLLLDAAAMLVEHELRGIADGPATIDLDWERLPGLVVDLSALLTDRKALRLVLTAAAGWLTGVMYGQPGRPKLTVVDEGWVALEDLAVVRFLQDQWRLGRQFGCANVLITHALGDLRSQVDDGAAQGKIAEGLLNTTSVRVFLHQNPEQIGRLLADLGLTSTEAGLLDGMPPFQALWKIGAQTALVDHLVTPAEWAFCDTDAAMTGRAQSRA